MRFALSIYSPELAASVAVLNRLADSACLPANGTNMRYALIKPTIIAIRRRIILMKISATSPSSHKEGVSDEAAAEHIRQHIPEHDVLLAGFPCQPFSLAGVSKELARAGARFCLRYPGHAVFLMWYALSTRVVRRCLCSKTSKNLKSHDRGKNVPHHHADAGRTGL